MQKIFLSFVLFVSGFAFGPLVAAGAVVSSPSPELVAGSTLVVSGKTYVVQMDPKTGQAILVQVGPIISGANKLNSESISSSVAADQAIPGGFHGQ